MMADIRTSIDKSTNWLLSSGIQNTDGSGECGGGFNAWYDLENYSYPYVYSEITGYGVTLLLYLNRLYGGGKYIDRAKMAADWLIKHALLDCGGILTRKYLQAGLDNHNYSFDSGVVYAFDAGMALFGMTNLYKQTGEKKYFEAAKKIGNFLLTMQKKDGLFWPIYNAKTGEFKDINDKWSTQSGSFHSKLSLGLLALLDATNDERFGESAIKLCGASLNFQEPSGRFISFKDVGATHMHPHCYSCEGLYYAGKKLKNKTYLAAAAKGIIWSLGNQLGDGGMPCIYDENAGLNKNQRSDTLAQVLRAAVYFLNDGLDAVKKYELSINKLALKLSSLQKTEGEQAGGFYYGYAEDGKKMDHINSWCSMFGAQALINLERHLAGYKLNPDYLV